MSRFDSFWEEGATSSSFALEVAGKTLGRFQEVGGLSVSMEVVDVVEGGQPSIRRLPGPISWSNVTLKRGLTADNSLLEWMQEASAPGASRTLVYSDVAIVLFSSKQDRLRTWTLADAIPVRWGGPDFTLASDDVLVEELEIAHSGFRVTNHGQGFR